MFVSQQNWSFKHWYVGIKYGEYDYSLHQLYILLKTGNLINQRERHFRFF